jgi:hypothetical protein
MFTCTFSQANLGKMTIRAVLYPLGICVLYCIAAARVLHVSLTSENMRKVGGFRSKEYSILGPWQQHLYSMTHTPRWLKGYHTGEQFFSHYSLVKIYEVCRK